jgi:Flp pilus assembly pilin Flp
MNKHPCQHKAKQPVSRYRRQGGAALAEYAIITFLFVLVLVGGPNVLHQLAQALSDAYQSFVFALSAP